MSQLKNMSYYRDFLFGKTPEGFKGTPGFKGGQLRRLDALGQLEKAIEGTSELGPAGEQQIADWTKTATAQAQQNAARRGLSNSSILGSTETGISAHAERARLALKESIQDRINQLRGAMADVFTRGSFGSAPVQSGGFSFGGLLGGALGSFLGPIGQAGGSALGSALFDKNKNG